MENNNNIGLIILGTCIVIASFIIGISVVKFGSRAAAIEKGMTPQEYAGWMDTVN